jgi:hypothetical protein
MMLYSCWELLWDNDKIVVILIIKIRWLWNCNNNDEW